ncbi:MAG TPA: phage/plasmid primase, P4 family [Bryobacteraceae bacterium]|jgi:P4 family phage/plasmid primase-like protien
MTPLEAAIAWIRQGFSPVPVPNRSKRPVLNGWERLEISADVASQYFSGAPQNIGLLLGDKFGSTDVDCDCPEAITAARVLLPETGLIFGRQSKPFSHYFYRSDPPVRTQRFQDPVDQATLIELRGLSSDGTIGLQTIVPPSVHEAGEQIQFEQGFDGTAANIDADVLVSAVRRVAAVALLIRHWPAQGSRHLTFLALAGVFARSEWNLDDAKTLHRVIYRCLWPANPDLAAADSEVQSTFEKHSTGGDVTGIPTLAEAIDKKVIDTALRWLGIERAPRCSYLWNDTGNADRLANLYGHELIYCIERKSYYVWTGQQWLFDEFVEVEKRAEKTMLDAYAEVKQITDTDKRKAFLRFVNNSLSRAGLANMIHLTKKKIRQVSANDLDRGPWALNVENGTLDLRTGELRPHRPEDLLSKFIPLRYDPRAECPRFMAFLYRIMGSHPDASEGENVRAEQLVAYLQRVFGCAATGKPEKVLFVFYGEGNNGKTTLLEIIRDALGDREYAGQVQVDSLMIRPKEAMSNNAVNTDLADLQGCRFVSSSEVEQGQRLSLSRVKYLTGLGQIKARRLRENMITFQPTYKLFLDCNHRPVITDPNDAIWNRVKCIPFKIQIPQAEIDRNLPEKLRSELPGILRWIVEGAVRYYCDGLGDSPDVTAATEDYRQESDRLKEFFEDKCILMSSGDGDSWKQDKCWVPVSDLYGAYTSWADAMGHKYPLSKDSFDERLVKLGRKRDRVRPDGRRDTKQIRVWLGIRFRTPEDD